MNQNQTADESPFLTDGQLANETVTDMLENLYDSAGQLDDGIDAGDLGAIREASVAITAAIERLRHGLAMRGLGDDGYADEDDDDDEDGN